MGAMRSIVNTAADPARLPPPSTEARAFHEGMAGYRPTPVHDLPAVARELGLAGVGLKDESNRLGLPAFKVLGASWAVERALHERPDVRTLVAASAGNHGRAVAHVAALRGLRARIFLPGRSTPGRREAIAGEGAEVVVVDGAYEDAVAAAAEAAAQPDAIEIADIGDAGPARWVIDGYHTLFAEAAAQTPHDLVLVPVGCGSLAAAAARHGAATGAAVVGVEPVTAACLTASIAAGEPTVVETPGTTMAGLDCAELSTSAWPTLRQGVHGMITVSDAETHAAMRSLAGQGLEIGDCGAATLAALEALATEEECEDLRRVVGMGTETRVLLVATEGASDPEGYRRIVSGPG
jgi:diaminopropionate ammonia-lyase